MASFLIRADFGFLTSPGHYGAVVLYISISVSVSLAGGARCGVLDLIVLVSVWEVR